MLSQLVYCRRPRLRLHLAGGKASGKFALRKGL
jgi:hypothetical protein